jgi:hypothetical protein
MAEGCGWRGLYWMVNEKQPTPAKLERQRNIQPTRCQAMGDSLTVVRLAERLRWMVPCNLRPRGVSVVCLRLLARPVSPSQPGRPAAAAPVRKVLSTSATKVGGRDPQTPHADCPPHIGPAIPAHLKRSIGLSTRRASK